MDALPIKEENKKNIALKIKESCMLVDMTGILLCYWVL